MTCLPLFESTHSLLDEDDLVGDGLVPLNLQLHVVVVLSRRSGGNINKRAEPSFSILLCANATVLRIINITGKNQNQKKSPP